MTLRRILRACYTATLAAYPAAFRQQFGRQMARDFADRVADRKQRAGLASALWLAARGLANSCVSGWRERALTRVRASRRTPLRQHIGDLGVDLAHTLRIIRRQPMVSAWSAMTLAVALGATIVMYAVVDASLVRPLDLPDSGRVVTMFEVAAAPEQVSRVSLDNFRDWTAHASTMRAMAAMRAQSVNMTGLDTPERVRGGFVTAGFFDVAAVSPAIGRRLLAGDDEPSADPVVVLNHALWRDRFGRDPSILGRTVMLNNVPFVVVGVMPAGFYFPVDYVEAWLPARFYGGGGGSRSSRVWSVFGRFADGVSIERARAEFTTIAADMARAYPAVNANRSIAIEPLQRWLTGDTRGQLASVFGLVLLLLAAACGNVSSLQIGAGAVRRREMSIRAALGASRGRLIRQLIVENLVVALTGGATGLLLARLWLPLVVKSAPSAIFGLDRAAVDGRVTLVAFTMTVAAGLATGLLPALHWSNRARVADDALKGGTRSTNDRRAGRLRAVLVAGQTGLAVLLLTSGVLLVENHRALSVTSTGFEAAHRWTLEYRLPANKYRVPAVQAQFHEDVVARVSAVPGVASVALVRALPFSGNGDTISYRRADAPPDSAELVAELNTITDDYFRVMRVPLQQGRTFAASDSAKAPPRVVVSESFAARTWPGENPIGRRIAVAGLPSHPEVIGVVGDVRQHDLASELRPGVYARNLQNPAVFMTLVAEAAGDPAALRDAVRAAIWSLDPDQPVWKERSLQSLVDESLRPTRFFSSTLMLVSAAALLLVMGGLYGVVSQSVSQRAREIGLRMALGATRQRVLWQVFRQGLAMSLVGVTLGLPAAFATTRILRGALTIVTPVGVFPVAVAVAVLVAVGMAACYPPARRATSVDPAAVLRD